ncbi:hypothetical protein EXIGLDRAFT_504068 [Exidia glandulosa HHB12029]|uniref:Uncharacterized protein n=1 Tax=Exidia glandulosa HHB12029 TaxID=1314781 RepID=A0A166N5V7_EXIGL|nr:hypothetical protein EXIGLDRAFT_504068 [Exidia glandulosa HHB12029]
MVYLFYSACARAILHRLRPEPDISLATLCSATRDIRKSAWAASSTLLHRSLVAGIFSLRMALPASVAPPATDEPASVIHRKAIHMSCGMDWQEYVNRCAAVLRSLLLPPLKHRLTFRTAAQNTARITARILSPVLQDPIGAGLNTTADFVPRALYGQND